jgi:hypothetical protein
MRLHPEHLRRQFVNLLVQLAFGDPRPDQIVLDLAEQRDGALLGQKQPGRAITFGQGSDFRPHVVHLRVKLPGGLYER